jgi:hypothetical protein
MGTVLHLPEPPVADDQSIAHTLPRPAQAQGKVGGVVALLDAGAAVDLWAVLRMDLAGRLGSGLRRRTLPTPVLLAPAHCGDLAFNDFTQDYEWAAYDREGERVILALPAEDDGIARRLAEEVSRGTLILAETAGVIDRPSFKPIAVLQDSSEGLRIINLRLDTWPRTGGLLNAVKLPWRRQASGPPARRRDPLLDLAERAVDAAVETLAGAPPRNIDALAQVCEAAGLMSLAQALQHMGATRDIRSVLAAAYLAGEIMTALSWE